MHGATKSGSKITTCPFVCKKRFKPEWHSAPARLRESPARTAEWIATEGMLRLQSAALPAAQAESTQFDCLIRRPLACCTGRAFIGYSRANTAIWSAESCTGCCITIHSTPSLHGGVVNEPM
jgi:hypothetical protein